MPTEAEWEYAPRGPDGLIYPWGNTVVGENVVHIENSHEETATVGSSPGGESWVGALDLSGNVWEWVYDWFGENYSANSPIYIPTGPTGGTYRIVRGGSWLENMDYMRAVFRLMAEPVNRYDSIGFRCARSVVNVADP